MIAEGLKNLNIKLNPGKLFYGPEWLVLGVNNICNLHCKMCDVGTQNQSTIFSQNLVGTSPLNMPPELFKRIADQTKKYYPTTKLGYAFTEPLIYPHLEETLAYTNSLNLHTSITTNALNLRQKADIILENRLNELFISLDGPQDIHNHIRGHKSSFQRAIQGIEALLENEFRPEISVFCVITEWNIGHLQEFLEFFKKYPLKRIGFMHMNFTPKSIADKHNLLFGKKYNATESNMDEINIDKLDLKVLEKEIQEIKNQSFPFQVNFSPDINGKEALINFYHHPEKLIGKRCNDIFSNIMIKSDGSVIPAHGRCYNIKVGNINELDLNEIWNSPVISNFRKDIMKEGGLFPACSRCCSAY